MKRTIVLFSSAIGLVGVMATILTITTAQADSTVYKEYYQITGTSNHVGWTWYIDYPRGTGQGSTFASVAPVANGASAEVLRDAYVDSIVARMHPGLSAARIGTDKFVVTLDKKASQATGPFNHSVTKPDNTLCNITGNPNGCEFNPLIKVIPVGGISNLTGLTTSNASLASPTSPPNTIGNFKPGDGRAHHTHNSASPEDSPLQTFDGLLTVTLFSSLAGLSLAVASFLFGRSSEAKEAHEKANADLGDARRANNQAEVSRLEPQEEELRKTYQSISDAPKRAVFAFFSFVFAMGTSLTLDSFDPRATPAEIVNVSATGAPLVVGMALLTAAAYAILDALPEGVRNRSVILRLLRFSTQRPQRKP
jgi:hypothetical protein